MYIHVCTGTFVYVRVCACVCCVCLCLKLKELGTRDRGSTTYGHKGHLGSQLPEGSLEGNGILG